MKATDSGKSFFEQIGLAVVTLPFVAVVAVLIAVPLMLFRAFILRYLWVWFVVPVFGLAPLTYGAAMGLALVVSLFSSRNPVKQEYKDSTWTLLKHGLLIDAIGLGLGYLIHRFWM